MKTIVITGGNGLLGFEVIRLLSESDNIEIISLQSSLPQEVAFSNVTFIQADLSQDTFYSSLPSQVDAVIHLAQSNNFRKFPEMANDIFDINCKATQRLLDYAVKAKASTFVFASTGGVYASGNSNCQEDIPLTFEPKSGFYPSSKFIAELIVKNYSQLLNTIIFRPFFMYGKRQKKDMLIPRLIGNVIAGNEIQLDGENGLRINPIHVSDAAQALVKSLSLTGSHVFNLAGNEVMSLREIGEQIADVFQTQAKFSANLSKQSSDLIADTTKLQAELYLPKIDFKQGLTEFLENEK